MRLRKRLDGDRRLTSQGSVRAQLMAKFNGAWAVWDHRMIDVMILFLEAFDIGEWQVRLAERHVRAGRFSVAEGTYRKVLARQPGQKSALAALGRLLLHKRRFEEAVEIWQRAVDVAPDSHGPAFQLARALHRSGRVEAAAERYLHVLTLDPLHEKAFAALEQLSDRLAKSGWDVAGAVEAATAHAQQLPALLAAIRSKSDPDAAVEHLTQLAALNPQSVEPLLQVARIRKRQQRGDEARHFYRAVLDRDPEHKEALAGYGHSLANTDRTEAIRHFVAWAERQPRDYLPRLELAQLYQKSREWDHAEAIYRDILERIPNDRKALSHFAQLLPRSPGRIEQALELWRRIAQRDPTTPFPLVQRAYLLERARRPGEAEVEYRAALQRAPGDATALIGLAHLLSNRAQWDEAAALFEALHRISPSRGDALLGLGRCFERLDRSDDALVAYQKALALDPTNANALLYRGRLLRQIGRIDEAIEAWRQVCAQSPRNADAWHELVFMLASAERDGEALAALDAAEAALPATPPHWMRLGLAAQAGQFHERAIAYFERAIAAEPYEASHQARLGQHYFRQGILDGAFHHLLASRELKPTDLAVTKQLVDIVHTLNIVGIDHIDLYKAARRQGDVLVPERLFRLVREIADKQIVPYEPVPRRVIAVTASLAAGGAERQLVNLLRGLSAPPFGLDPALFCLSLARRTHRDFFLPMLAETSIEIVTPAEGAIGTWLSAPESAPYERLIRSFPADMAGPIAFWLDEFHRRRPQVVHAWQDNTNLIAVVAALLAGVPRIVLSARSLRPDNPRRRLKRFMREGYQAVLGHPSVVLSNNSRVGADDYAAWLGIDPATVEVVHNGIDFEQLAQSVDLRRVGQIRGSLDVPPDAPVVGGVFRMSEEKRPLLWVEVAAEVARQEPRAHFIVCGDGPMRVDMLNLAAQLGIADRLHLLGAQDNIASCYKAMDIVMLTSRHEGLPNVLLEAQSLGVPVVAPDVGGISETVWQGVTGWTVPESDSRALAERALFCLADWAWASRARAEAPLFVRKRFGIAAMLRRTLEVYSLTNPRGTV